MSKAPLSGPSLPRYRELDGVRGVAALAVFFHHVCYSSLGQLPRGATAAGLAERFLFRISAVGSAGVDLFFVLSGFLITSLLIKDRESTDYYRDFYWKRVLRILPLYLLSLAILFWAVPGSGRYVLLALVFLPNCASVLHVPALGPFWSLGIEEQFYLGWPFLLRHRATQQIAHLAKWLWIGVVLLRFIAACFGHYNYFLTPFRLDGLAAGAYLACRASLRQEAGQTLAADLPALRRAGIAGLLLGTLLAWPPSGSALQIQALVAAALQAGVTLLAFCVVGLMVGYAGSNGLRFMRSAPLLFFGTISYAFYMTHAYVMATYDRFAGPLEPDHFSRYALRFFAILAATCLVCLLTRYLIELPALSLRRFVLRRPAPQPEIAEPLVLGKPERTV